MTLSVWRRACPTLHVECRLLMSCSGMNSFRKAATAIDAKELKAVMYGVSQRLLGESDSTFEVDGETYHIRWRAHSMSRPIDIMELEWVEVDPDKTGPAQMPTWNWDTARNEKVARYDQTTDTLVFELNGVELCRIPNLSTKMANPKTGLGEQRRKRENLIYEIVNTLAASRDRLQQAFRNVSTGPKTSQKCTSCRGSGFDTRTLEDCTVCGGTGVRKASVTPKRLSRSLRVIADKIENSQQPSRRLVVAALLRLMKNIE